MATQQPSPGATAVASGGNEGRLQQHDHEEGKSMACYRLNYFGAPFRFSALFLIVVVVFSGYFSYDLPGITSEKLKSELGLTNTQLGLLFSVYALPNAVVPLLSGSFYHAAGAWRGVIAIAIMISAGTAVIAAGVGSESFPTLLLGRLVYGLGGESVYVGVDVLATDWFKNAELGLAYGLIQSAGQAGSFAAFYGVPLLIERFGVRWQHTYLIGVGVSTAAVLCLWMAHLLEEASVYPPGYVEAELEEEAEEEEGGDEGDNTEDVENVEPDVEALAVNKAEKLSSGADATASGVSPESSDSAGDGGAGENGDEADSGIVHRWLHTSVGRKLGLNHFAFLPWQFFAVLVSIVAYSGCFYTFLAFGNDYLQTKYGMHAEESGQLVGAISIASCFISPLAGLLLDKRGGRPFVACGSMIGSCLAFTVMGFAPAGLPVLAPIAVAGICYSILPSALYPIIANVVPEEAFTQTYATINGLTNLVLMISFYVAGALSETTVSEEGGGGSSSGANYTGVFVMLAIYCAIGSGATAVLSWDAYQEWLREKREAEKEEERGEEEAGEEEKEEEEAEPLAPAPLKPAADLPAPVKSSLAAVTTARRPKAVDFEAETLDSKELPPSTPASSSGAVPVAAKRVTMAEQATTRTVSGKDAMVVLPVAPSEAEATAPLAHTRRLSEGRRLPAIGPPSPTAGAARRIGRPLEPAAAAAAAASLGSSAASGGSARGRASERGRASTAGSPPHGRSKSAEPVTRRRGPTAASAGGAAGAAPAAASSGSRPVAIPARPHHILPGGRALIDARFRSGFSYSAGGGASQGPSSFGPDSGGYMSAGAEAGASLLSRSVPRSSHVIPGSLQALRGSTAATAGYASGRGAARGSKSPNPAGFGVQRRSAERAAGQKTLAATVVPSSIGATSSPGPAGRGHLLMMAERPPSPLVLDVEVTQASAASGLNSPQHAAVMTGDDVHAQPAYRSGRTGAQDYILFLSPSVSIPIPVDSGSGITATGPQERPLLSTMVDSLDLAIAAPHTAAPSVVTASAAPSAETEDHMCSYHLFVSPEYRPARRA